MSIKVNDAQIGNIQLKEDRLKHDQSIEDLLKTPAGEKILTRHCKLAFDKGFAQGREEGVKTQMQELKDILEALRQTVDSWAHVQMEWVEKMQPRLVSIVQHMVEHVLGRELVSGSVAVVDVVKPIIHQLPKFSAATIFLNSQDYGALVRSESGLMEEFKQNRVTFEERPEINSGDVVIETDMGHVDASLKTRLEELSRLFSLSKK